MCGICGAISLSTNQSSAELVQGMVTTLHHRGPDSNGFWSNEHGNVNLGHTRLSIIDLEERSSQPFLTYDKNFVIVFNGELYNFIELREECKKLGSRFYTESDTEVFVECYRHWGKGCFSRFKGMWAAVIYDIRLNQVCLSRDFFGIKPLYFSLLDNTFYFASEIKALKNLFPKLKKEDEITSRMFMEHGILDRGNWTFYKNIKKFPHCSYTILDLKKVSFALNYHSYWSPFDKSFSNNIKNEKIVTSTFRDLLEESIKLHCRSDVRIGSCLSGGLDSSSIVTVASKLNSDFSTFTTKYPLFPEIDESEAARSISEIFGTRQYYAEPSLDDFKNHFDDILRAQDEPYGTTSIFSQFMVFKRIAETNVKVILDGQGADEILGGYIGLTGIALNTYLNRGMYLSWVKETVNFSKNHQIRYVSNLKQSINDKIKSKKKEDSLFDSYLTFKDSDEYEDRMHQLILPPTNDIEEYLTYLTFDGNLQQLLRYEDRNSMNFSIESRVPFLEPDLVSFILQVPFQYKFRSGYTKYLLRKAFEKDLPKEIIWQKNKLGFASPEKFILKELYGLNTDGAGGGEWRKVILRKWRELNNE